MKNANLQNLFFILGVLVMVFVASILFKAPKPLPATSFDKEFSANRAFEHTKQIAQRPHSVGTEEHEIIKNYIITELQKLGLKISVQTTTSINYRKVLMAGYVHNIIGIIKGTEGKKSVLIVGHYDTKPNALGAADDGSAVASMLEAARALKQVGSFKNDIIFLFTDGEEAEMFGATAFVEENSLKDSVGIVLNVDARGSSGPSLTYEVSSHNGWIMKEYAKAVPYPFAHSIAYEVYKLMPAFTDFTPFKNAGLSGFNIAFIDDYANYHSMADTPENLNLGSLQHHGSYIMGIAKHFGNLDLTNTKSDDVVYFNWIGHSLIIYPIGYNMFLGIIISLLLISVVSVGVRKTRLSISKILLSSLAFITTLVITLLLTYLLLITIKLVYPHYSNYYSSNFYNVKYYFIAFSCLAIAVFSTIYTLMFKRISVENLLVGSLLVNFILMFVFLIYIPTGAYLAIVPLILVLAGLMICYVFNYSLEEKRWAFLLIHFVALVPVISLLVPLTGMLFVSFGLNTIYGGVAVLVIMMSYMVMPVKIFYERKKWSLPIIVLFFLVGNLIAGQLTSGYSKQQPLQSNVSYYLNNDNNEALWISSIQYTDEWKSQFFNNPEFKPLPDLFPNLNIKYLQNKAQVYPQSLPEMSVVSDSANNGVREINLKIRTARNAQNCQISISKDAYLSTLSINGKRVSNEAFYTDKSSRFYTLYYFGLSEKELELKLDCISTKKIEVVVVESKLGIPQFEGYKMMPDYIIPEKDYISSVTLVKRTWKL